MRNVAPNACTLKMKLKKKNFWAFPFKKGVQMTPKMLPNALSRTRKFFVPNRSLKPIITKNHA